MNVYYLLKSNQFLSEPGFLLLLGPLIILETSSVGLTNFAIREISVLTKKLLR